MDRDEAAVDIKESNVGDLFGERVMEAGKKAFNHFALTLHFCGRKDFFKAFRQHHMYSLSTY